MGQVGLEVRKDITRVVLGKKARREKDGLVAARLLGSAKNLFYNLLSIKNEEGESDGGTKDVFDVCGKRLAGVAAIDQHIDNIDQISFVESKPFQSTSPICDVGGGDMDHMRCNPFVSTPICRLMPDTSLPPSKAFCSAVSVFLTLCASTIRKGVWA